MRDDEVVGVAIGIAEAAISMQKVKRGIEALGELDALEERILENNLAMLREELDELKAIGWSV